MARDDGQVYTVPKSRLFARVTPDKSASVLQCSECGNRAIWPAWVNVTKANRGCIVTGDGVYHGPSRPREDFKQAVDIAISFYCPEGHEVVLVLISNHPEFPASVLSIVETGKMATPLAPLDPSKVSSGPPKRKPHLRLVKR